MNYKFLPKWTLRLLLIRVYLLRFKMMTNVILKSKRYPEEYWKVLENESNRIESRLESIS